MDRSSPSPRPRHTVAVLVCPQHSLGSLGLVLDIFRMANQVPGGHRFDLLRLSEDGCDVVHPDGVLTIDGGPQCMVQADLVVIPSLWTEGAQAVQASPQMVRCLAQLPQGTQIATLCTGVYLLAASGRLDGREVTTHWQLAEPFQSAYPRVHVQPDHNLVSGADLLCSGGALAGIDACLAAVARLAGPETAQALSRLLVTPLSRGPQSRYVPPLGVRRHNDAGVHALQRAMAADVATSRSLADMAASLHVSVRTLQRRFLQATGQTPTQCHQALRIEQACRWLEGTRWPVDLVAERVGYADRVAFGRQFKKVTGVTPAAWRQQHREQVLTGRSGPQQGLGA